MIGRAFGVLQRQAPDGRKFVIVQHLLVVLKLHATVRYRRPYTTRLQENRSMTTRRYPVYKQKNIVSARASAARSQKHSRDTVDTHEALIAGSIMLPIHSNRRKFNHSFAGSQSTTKNGNVGRCLWLGNDDLGPKPFYAQQTLKTVDV